MITVYEGTDRVGAYQQLIKELDGVKTMLHLCMKPVDVDVRDKYVTRIVHRQHDLLNIINHFLQKSDTSWIKYILRQINELLYEMHLLIQIPVIQYKVLDGHRKVVKVLRDNKREIT